jgi:hypothetical protein
MARPPLPAPSRPAGHPPLSRRAIPGNGSPAKPHDADLPESPPGPVNGLRPPDKESSALPFPSPLMSASPSLPLWDRPPLASAQTAPPPGVRPDGRPRWPTALRAGRPSRRRSGGSARAMRQAPSRIRGWRPRPFPHAGGEIGPGDGMLEPEPQRLQGTAQAPERRRPSDAAASLPPAEQIRPEALRLRPHGLRVRIPPRRQQALRQQPQLLPLPPDPGRPAQMPRRPRQARLRRPEGAARGLEKGHQIRRQRLKPPRPQDLRRPRQKRRRLGRPEAAPPDPPPRGPIRQLLRPDGRRGRLRTACSSRWRSIPGKARTQTVWPPSECAGNGISPGPDPPRALCRRDSSHPQKPGRPAASDRGSGKRTEARARGLHRRRSLADPRHDHPSRLSTGLIPPTERPMFSRLDRAFRLFRTQGNRPPLPHASCGPKQSAARKSGKPHGPGPPRRPKRHLRWIPGAIRPGEALRLPASFRPEGDPPGPISGSRPESSRETTGSRPGGPGPAPHPARSGEADGSPEGSPAEAGRKAPASPGAVWDRILPGPTRSMRSRTPGESPGRPRIPSTSRG